MVSVTTTTDDNYNYKIFRGVRFPGVFNDLPTVSLADIRRIYRRALPLLLNRKNETAELWIAYCLTGKNYGRYPVDTGYGDRRRIFEMLSQDNFF
jgi:hypothetical protein